jgi:ribosomal protein L40E
MEIAQLTEPNRLFAASSDLTWLLIILLGLGGIGFILAGLRVSGKLPKWNKASLPTIRRSSEQSLVAPQINSKYCPQCGTANPLTAGFCTKCGNKFPST